MPDVQCTVEDKDKYKYAALGPRIIKARFRTSKGKATVIQV